MLFDDTLIDGIKSNNRFISMIKDLPYLAISSAAASQWPFSTARWSAVFPSLSIMSTHYKPFICIPGCVYVCRYACMCVCIHGCV